MKRDTILKSFQATGVWPMDAEVVLQRFNNHTLEQDKALEIGQHGDGDSWIHLRKLFDAAVADKAKVEAKQLSAAVHSLQTNNDILHTKIDGLRSALLTKKKHNTRSYTMDLHQNEQDTGGAVFWSPKKLRDACAREATKRDEAQREKLQKREAREAKAAASFLKKQHAEEAKAERQRLKEHRAVAKKAAAEERDAARARKKQQQQATTSQKSHDRPNKRTRETSHKVDKIPAKRRRVAAPRSQPEAAPAPPPAPPKSTRTRSIRAPKKYSE
ncbi:hypothetical protein EJ02DRAFT_356124 [Clathrospora elynae]|uniref:Uncharacterized protein n=1 Tax=Clathrospora elynae TaxID=706981 RepID=A0A6A5SDM5_9PLEO|nr:hypothetical protein EJ02DRAFT_356124 [Clathrospora elynae]